MKSSIALKITNHHNRITSRSLIVMTSPAFADTGSLYQLLTKRSSSLITKKVCKPTQSARTKSLLDNNKKKSRRNDKLRPTPYTLT